MRSSALDSSSFASSRAARRSAATPCLRIQQPSSDHEEVGERCGHFEPVQILGETAVADLAGAEDALDHPDRVLDLGPNPRLSAVPGLLDLIDATGVAVAPVGEVASFGSTSTDRRGLPLIPLVSPDARLVPCNRCGSASRSCTLAAEARIVWISFVRLSTPTCAFIRSTTAGPSPSGASRDRVCRACSSSSSAH